MIGSRLGLTTRTNVSIPKLCPRFIKDTRTLVS
ncbi:hypothetical protein Godav_015803 [Gossypium davidsonii]|uniref:Uncharacterized protein n=1 Tax=Gossypium davidsonii TaxID=34287 RepID=A0A7J8RPE1_GOSDV|nr:hypothetical protein [Gossypium davidsonii]